MHVKPGSELWIGHGIPLDCGFEVGALVAYWHAVDGRLESDLELERLSP